MIAQQTHTFVSDGLTLQGTLATPSAPRATALLISGSGPMDRNSNTKSFAINVMREIADHLAAEEITSFRYDKRGVGASDGDYHASGFFDNVADARAALDFVLTQDAIDPDRVFLVGHSEGALIASELADDERLAGVVLLASSAKPGRDLLTWQARQVAATLPTPVRWFMKLLRKDLVKTQAKRLDQIAGTTDDTLRVRFVKLNAKWLREFMAFDPTESLRRVAVPVLAITGSKDLQVDPTDVQQMGTVVSAPFTGQVLDDLTHLLRREDGRASLLTYKKQRRQPVDHRVLETVSQWIKSTAPDRSAPIQ